MDARIDKTDDDWKRELTPEEYHVLRESGTERAFTGRYWDHHEDGEYRCRACGEKLFDSGTKFDSGSGWPSFTEPMNLEHIELVPDTSYGMLRNEVRCASCGSHLGHVFDDGPGPTGERYCINSCSLDFKERDEQEEFAEGS